MANFIVLSMYYSGFLYALVILSWEFIRRKLGPNMNQRKYSTLIVVIGVVLPPLLMILLIALVSISNPSDLVQIISDFPFYGGLLIAYILITAIGGWQYSKLYPVKDSKTLED